jgi:hypothetical protein
VAIVSGRRAVRPDSGHYRNMRRQRFTRSPAGRQRRTATQRVMTVGLVLLLVAGAAYAAGRMFLSR